MAARTRTARPLKRSLANEVVAVVMIAIAVLVLLSLFSYSPKDASLNSAGPSGSVSNTIGVMGAYVSDFLLQWFGLAAFIIPILLGLLAFRAFFSAVAGIPVRKAIGSAMLLLALSGFLALFPDGGFKVLASSRNGGALGFLIESSLSKLMNTTGAAIILTVTSVLTLMLTMEVSLKMLAQWGPLARLRLKEDGDASESGAPESGGLMAWAAGIADSITAWRRKRVVSKRMARAQQHSRLEAEREERTRRRQELLGADRSTPVFDLDDTVSKSTVEISDREGAAPSEEISDSPIPISREVVTTRTVSEAKQTVVSTERPREPSGARADAAAALRARAARFEDSRDVTMDPDIVEMVSTASIVRTPSEQPLHLATRPGESSRAKKSLVARGYTPPSITLLESTIGHHEEAEEELRERATILAEKCKEFSVTGHIHRINPGPVVTTFEFKPDPGVKYSRVVSLADDLCLALKAESIRIDRIPGKSTVGIEVPNAHREKIQISEVIESPKFQQLESKLAIALGKTINGEVYVADLAKMPHLLIAGATGAGKSVTLNSIICSMLYKSSPDEVKFIMVDPKRLELGLYEGIPHLLTPIVTDPKRAANALKWATNEMENRYRELAKYGVRNIEQYNRVVREAKHPTLFEDQTEAAKPLPFIVIAIDELADLMMIARGDVETSIARLAQMARAVGIHLIVATQRPSVDVITGVIKANFPSRIAFRVSSKVDSRTIIDSNGAESLLGQGDMLFMPPASSRLIRVHGSFVNESEITNITDHTRAQAQPDYNEEVTLSEQEAGGGDELSLEQDALFEEALKIVTDMGRASTSVLQRRLSIGYGRAAKILDIMEHAGMIGPADGAKPRKVLQAAYEFRERLAQKSNDEED